MNHDAPQPSFELPAPMPEAEGRYSTPFEQVPARPETSPGAGASQPVPVPQSSPNTASAIPITQQAPQVQASPISPAVADDNDLIEEEWVTKAKQIVAATREDPYTQTRELNKFKADYLKKRYNKDLKLEES